MKYTQCRKVLLSEAILLISPLVKVHTIVIRARNPTQKGHTVLGGPVTRSHDLLTATRRRNSIDRCDRPRRILLSMVCDV